VKTPPERDPTAGYSAYPGRAAVSGTPYCHADSQAPDNPNGVDTYIHYFHNSAWQTLETRETTTESDQPENLQPKYQYVWSPRYIDSAVLRDKNADTDGTCDDERLYYLNDANFNVATLVDTNGDAVERYLYDAYGKVTMFDGSWANVRSASSYANVVLYTGRERDAETGLYHYRHRSLAAELGRFGSRDPIGYDSGDEDLYRYVENAPADVTDWNGEAGHKKKRPSTEEKHEEGDARRDRDKGGEKGDKVRNPPRKRPPKHTGPWPPKPNPGTVTRCLLVLGGVCILVGTIGEDVCTLGGGVVDDPPCFACGGAMICAGFCVPQMSEEDNDVRIQRL
jgi:RHS repeat-associated protein